jgi:hypothetical protein
MQETKPEAIYRPPPSWKKTLATLLLILGLILIPFTTVAVWLRSTLLQTDQYVATVAPLSSNPEIASSIASFITQRFFERVDVSARVSQALPPNGQFLVPSITNGLENFTQNLVSEVIQSPQFNQLWTQANRIAHMQVVRLLTGGGEVITTAKGKVTLNLEPIVEVVKSRLNERGITIFNEIPASEFNQQFVIFDSPQLAKAQAVTKTLNQLGTILPILTALFLLLALLLTPTLARLFFWLGIGLVITGLLLFIAVLIGQTLFVQAATDGFSAAAAQAFYTTLTRFLRLSSLGIVLAGVLFVVETQLAKRASR